MLASQNKHIEVVNALLAAGADTNKPTKVRNCIETPHIYLDIRSNFVMVCVFFVMCNISSPIFVKDGKFNVYLILT